MSSSVRLRRVVPTLAATSAVVLLTAAPAGAHVTVSSPDAEPGGFGKLVFRVPSESDSAKTESVTVTLPTDTPLRSVSTKPTPGWDVETTTEKLDEPVEADGFEVTEAVTKVTWTATRGNGLNPHEFTELELSVGPFPASDEPLAFPAVQTYSDGEVVAWDQPTVEGEGEPEKPAPVLDLSGGEEAAADAAPASSTVSDAADPVARTLGGIGVGLGAAALLWVVLARRQSS